MRQRLPEILLIGLLAISGLGSTTSGALEPAAIGPDDADQAPAIRTRSLYARDNLVAWCIVPFDSKKRGPEERAQMLERLGFKKFAYDWRAEHIPTFDAELDALKRHGIKLQAFWVAPGELNRESRIILDVVKRHNVQTELWVILDLGPDKATGDEQTRRVEAAAAKLKPLAEEAGKIGCTVGLYNHGGWFGEPENQIAIIERLKEQGVTNLGIVYNLHHGHDHLGRFAELLGKMKPYLLAVNLNGMDPDGEKNGRKILPLGQGALDLELLRTIRDSGYQGPIGILGHTMDDAEQRLRDNLDGLDWLVPQLEGKPPGPKPQPRTPVPAAAAGPSDDAQRVAALLADARTQGDANRGAEVFTAPQFACISCHQVGGQGGTVGPDLTTVGVCVPPEQIAESVLWPGRQVKEGFAAFAVATVSGAVVQGYKQRESDQELVVREATTGQVLTLRRAEIEAVRELGTLMPEGLAEAMSPAQRRDLIRFLLELGRTDAKESASALVHNHVPASFPYDRKPLQPELWPSWQHHVNRDRLYDFYAKEAEYFRKQPSVPALLPPFPGLDGGRFGHWGNQDDTTWKDDRWNQTDLGTVMAGIFRGAGVTVPKGVCVRLGDQGEVAACFNPLTLRYEAVWKGGFVKFSPFRHGFLDGLIMDGTAEDLPPSEKPADRFVYHGYYRNGKRVIFSYRIGDQEWLDSPWVEDGRFSRTVVPANDRRLAELTRGGPAQSPQVLVTRGALGRGRPYAVDTIDVPFQNPWKAMLFFAGLDFLADGTAMLCTMQGDVWRVEGLDQGLEHVRWRRYASGLHHALGLVVSNEAVYVLGRDQITRLHDLNRDGEADFYECVSNAYETSTAGHDFICGLERDAAGNFYTASGNQGLLRVLPDGKRVEPVATGFRNPDGLGLSPEGVITVPCSEGEWTPASMICEIKPGGSYGYGGPRNHQPPDLPLVYLPRGLDHSSGSQVFVTSDRWGPLRGQMIHFSYGAGTHLLVLRDKVGDQPQGAVVPLPGEFLSGVHRGRFHPRDGQLYVAGMGGWNTFTVADGCFQRVRYTGDPVQLPVACHAHENGVLVTFTEPIDRAVAERPQNHFTQVWNYRYSAAYGSPEFSPRHAGLPGHDPLSIRSAWVLPDGCSLFLEMPDLQPVNQLHLHLGVGAPRPLDVFATVHKLAPPFTDFPGYTPSSKVIAAHPILRDLVRTGPTKPNPWAKPIADARAITIEAGKNLTFATRSLTARAGEPIRLTFLNPDVVPHNWALARPGTLARVGELVNRLIAEPDAVARHYIPKTDDVLVYTDIVQPQDQFTIFFHAPERPGTYPFLCTFPGHWMVMNGTLVVR